MLLLTGEYDLVIDQKNRLSIPTKLREQIPAQQDEAFYLVMGAERILNLYPEAYYKRLALAVAPRKVAPDESLMFDRINFALAGRVELDRQGRVLLNERALKRAGIAERVTLIGVRDHLEIWDQDRWNAYLDAHLTAHEAMLLQSRQEAMNAQGAGENADPWP